MSFRYRLVFSLLAMAGLALGASTAFAQGADNLNVRIALHTSGEFVPAKGVTVCDASPANPDSLNQECTTYTTAWGVPGAADVYIVAGQGGSPGIQGVSFGIDYTGSSGVGIDPQFVRFTVCTDGIEFPNDGGNGDFPAPGGGLRVTWQTCQNTVIGGSGVHATVGALYVYAYTADALKITPNNNLTEAPFTEFAVTDCSVTTVNILDFTAPGLIDQLGGRLDFGGGPGFTPCGIVNTQPTTWAKLKDKYTSDE